MTIKLYIDYNSQPSRAILALCIANNLPFEVVEVSILKGEHKGPELQKVNPMCKVPAILDTDNGLALAQSHSILRYLCQKFNLPEQWFPLSDIAKQAKINEFLDFHHFGTRKCTFLVFNLVIAPLLNRIDPSFNEQAYSKTVHEALVNFEKIYLKEQTFLGGEQPNIADLIAFHDITMLEIIDFDFFKYPKVQQWILRLRKQPYIIKANEKFDANLPLFKSKYTKSKPEA